MCSIQQVREQLLTDPQIHEIGELRKLRAWSHLLKKSFMENLTFCAVQCTFLYSPRQTNPKHKVFSKTEPCQFYGLMDLTSSRFAKLVLQLPVSCVSENLTSNFKNRGRLFREVEAGWLMGKSYFKRPLYFVLLNKKMPNVNGTPYQRLL